MLLGIGLVIVAVAWVLLARNPNANDQRAAEFGAPPAASQPVSPDPPRR